MTLRRFQWPEFTPDQPETLFAGSNVLPLPNGYRPVRAFQAITAPLPGFINGGAFIALDGTPNLLAGTATDLSRYQNGAWESVMGSLTAYDWRFDQFGNNVISVNGDVPIKYDLAAGTASVLGGSPPASSMVATVRQQAFLAGNPAENNLLTISGYNDSEGWTPGVNQSLNTTFPQGGAITGLCGGETALILQERAVRRATYTGDQVVWQFDEIARDVGCMAPGSVAQSGLLVFFLSDQGFKVCDRNEVIPIGSEKVDRTFFRTYSRPDIVTGIRCAVDPRTTTVMWAMPGRSGKIWAYNWTLKKWAPPIVMDVTAIFPGFSSNTTLEALDTLYPDGLDSIPYSLDDPIFNGGDPRLLVASNDGVVGTLTGDNLAASLSLSPSDLESGRIQLRSARPVSDVISGTVTVDVRARAGDPEKRVVSGAMRANGRVPLRANGRAIGVTQDFPAGDRWTYTNGLDLEFESAGER